MRSSRLPGDQVAAVPDYLDPGHVDRILRSDVTVATAPVRADASVILPTVIRRCMEELLAAGVPVALGTDGRPACRDRHQVETPLRAR